MRLSKSSSVWFYIMPASYPKSIPTLIDTPLPPEIYPLIGRLARAFANIEDLFLQDLACLCEMNDEKVKLIIGTQGMRKTIDLLGYISRSIGGECQAYHDYVFKFISGPLKVRNILVHGKYLGIDENKNYFFATGKPIMHSAESKLRFEALGLNLESIEAATLDAEEIVPKLPALLRLEEWLRSRPDSPLEGHPKAPNARQRSKGQKPRRKSSPQ